jgi:spoIIIJ-associated protein
MTSNEPAAPTETSPTPRLEQEGEVAADYLEELLDIVDLDGDIEIDVENDRAVVAVVADDGAALDALIGRDGEVLEALQELSRLAVQSKLGERSRMMLDVGGYRARRREELAAVAIDAVDRVRATGTEVALDAMNAFERKVVHDVVAQAGLGSDSRGVEPSRYVVVLPQG